MTDQVTSFTGGTTAALVGVVVFVAIVVVYALVSFVRYKREADAEDRAEPDEDPYETVEILTRQLREMTLSRDNWKAQAEKYARDA